MAIELSREEFDNLKESIKKTMHRLEVLQRLHESQTGERYKPFYLTDPVNRSNLETNIIIGTCDNCGKALTGLCPYCRYVPVE